MESRKFQNSKYLAFKKKVFMALRWEGWILLVVMEQTACYEAECGKCFKDELLGNSLFGNEHGQKKRKK